MPKNNTKIKKMNEIVNAAEAILDFHSKGDKINNQQKD